MTLSRLRIASQGLAALCAAVLLGVGVPTALWRFTGAPIFSAPVGGWYGWTQQLSDEVLVWLLAQVCWLAWGLLAAALLAEGFATARHRLAPALPVPSLLRRLAAQLIASVVLLGTLAPGATRPQGAGRPLTAITTAATITEIEEPEPTPPAAPSARHVVQPREDLWSIAAQHLGDPYRWREIWTLNQGREMRDGQRFTNPDHIRPGWTLALPPAIRTETETPSTPFQLARRTPSQQTEPCDPPEPPTTLDDGQSTHDEPPVPPGDPLAPVSLPGGGLVTLGFAAGITTALALARLHERRRYTPGQVHAIAPHEPLATKPAICALVQAAQTAGSPSAPQDAPAEPPAGMLWQHGVTVDCGDREDIARGLLAEVLVGEPDMTTVLAVGEAATVLPEGPGIAVQAHPTLDSALARVEVELIRRTRTLDAAGVSDFATLRAAQPQEPIGLTILVAAAPLEPSPRLDAALRLGQRLGIRGLILGRYDAGELTYIGDDSADLSCVLPRLDRDEAADVLRALAASLGEDHATPVDPTPGAQPAPEGAPTPPSLYVRMFGPLRVTVGGRDVAQATRPKALELLAYLLTHPSGASKDAIAEALWPEADPNASLAHLRTLVSRVRALLRTATGHEEADFITLRATGHYEIDANLLDCDLWQHERVLRHPNGGSPAQLQTALDLYTGDLLDGSYYNWVDPTREASRRRTLDAASQLADQHQHAGDLEAAIQALERAIEIDPYAEALYTRLIELQLSSGRLDAALRTYRVLESRLHELGVEPSETTTTLLSHSAPNASRTVASSCE